MSRLRLNTLYVSLALLSVGCLATGPQGRTGAQTGEWTVDSQQDWLLAAGDAGAFALSDGTAAATDDGATFESRLRSFPVKQRFSRITFEQTDDWHNWRDAGNLGPTSEPDAPVFISPAAGDYWYLNRDPGSGSRDYHAWHSTDMKTWTHYGNVTGKDWVTTAEYADGRFYIYYDEPDDEDPHLIIDDDLTDGAHQEVGKVFDDPSHGSDAAVFRDADGTFHLIYEDWSAIKAKEHSWDSQYAGHADSPDGINGFAPHEHPAPIDRRGKPTGGTGTYTHPHNGKYTYEKYDGSLDAYGDYAMIRVGPTYYLFCDYHPEGGAVALGYWKSKDLNGPFEWGGRLRDDMHPDPAVGFAEGEFVMFVQDGDDLTSPGPWIDGVEAQVGVDTDGDGEADVWTDWQTVRETYARRPGFARIIDRIPAELDLSSLPEGYGVQFRFRTSDKAAVMDRVEVASTPIPEPATVLLIGVGAAGLLTRRRRRR